MRAFDLDINLIDPIEQSTYCFKQLFTSFRLGGLLYPDHESLYIESSCPSSTSCDLTRLFRLMCLCLDESHDSLPSVKFGSVQTVDPKSPTFDSAVPIQSYLRNVFLGLDASTSDIYVSKVLALEGVFESTCSSELFRSWQSVNHSRRAQIMQALEPSSASLRTVQTRAAFETLSTSGSPKPSWIPKPKRRCSHLLVEDVLSESTSRPNASSRKPQLY